MDERMIEYLMSTATSISNNLDVAPHSWRDQLQAIRSITTSRELTPTVPSQAHRRWQLPLISVFQRVAFADADNGTIQDIADWCLRQALVMLQIYPEDAELLALIGRNWLLRSQKSLANIYQAERSSSSSDESLYSRPERRSTDRAIVEAEQRLNTADYVEARGLLLAATECLQRAVIAARAQGSVTGALLSTAAEAHMSLGNVTSVRINARYFQQAMAYLRATREDPNYSLPAHLEQYLDEYGPLYP